jgi:site-specific DNA recombinase
LEVPEDWVFEDDGYSGTTLMRPALERLRDLAAQADLPVVLCHSPDRLARKYAYQVVLLEEFARVGTEVRFLKGGKGDSAEAELLLQFQGMIAEYEKAQIAERTRRGRLHRARQGSASVLSCAPYGYRYVAKRDGADARFEVVEHEASVVREIFRRYVKEPISLGQLARELSALGIPTATGKRCWSASALGYIVRNPVYRGRAAYGKKGAVTEPVRSNRRTRLRGRRSTRVAYRRRPQEQWIEIPVPAIVSQELFEQAARRSSENERFARRRTLTPSLLQGLVVCECCGYRMYRSGGRPTGGQGRYRCPSSKSQERSCTNRSVRQSELEDVVWKQIIALISDPSLVRNELERRVYELQRSQPYTERRASLERERARTRRAMERLTQAYQEDLLDLDELRQRLPALRQTEATLRTQLATLDAQQLDRQSYLHLAENLESFLGRLSGTAQSSPIVERQRVVRLLVNEVLVGPDRIVVRHSIPTSTPDPVPGSLLHPKGPVPFSFSCWPSSEAPPTP